LVVVWGGGGGGVGFLGWGGGVGVWWGFFLVVCLFFWGGGGGGGGCGFFLVVVGCFVWGCCLVGKTRKVERGNARGKNSPVTQTLRGKREGNRTVLIWQEISARLGNMEEQSLREEGKTEEEEGTIRRQGRARGD